MPTRKQLALLHVAKRELNLDEAMYRAVLARGGRVESARDLTAEGFTAVMAIMEHLGFAPAVPAGPDYGNRPGFASPAQLALIRALWNEYTGGRATEATMCLWLKRSFKIDSLRFMTASQARAGITALKMMKARKRAA